MKPDVSLIVPFLVLALTACSPERSSSAADQKSPAPATVAQTPPAASPESSATALKAWPHPPPPEPPKTVVLLSDDERYSFHDSPPGRRLSRDVRAYLGGYRATYYYTNELLSRQIIEGFDGYYELLSAPGGRRIYWGYRKHAGRIHNAILYDADGALMAVAVRDFEPNAGMVVKLYLPEGKDGRLEEGIFRDWAQYMIAQLGQDDGTDVQIVRLPKR